MFFHRFFLFSVFLFLYNFPLFSSGLVHYSESFGPDWSVRWRHASNPLTNSGDLPSAGQFDVSAGRWHSSDSLSDAGLHTPDDSRYYAISSPLPPSLAKPPSTLVLQFSLKHEQFIECGGGFLKLLDSSLDQDNFNGDSSYLVKFGQDNCGTEVRHIVVHIPVKGGQGDGELVWKFPIRSLDDRLTHFYTLILDQAAGEVELRLDGQTALSDDGIRVKGAYKDMFALKRKAADGSWLTEDWSDSRSLLLSDSLAFIGFELWQVKGGSVFDDLLVADSVADAERVIEKRFNQNRIDEEKQMFQEAEKERLNEETRLRAEIERLRAEQDEELAAYLEAKKAREEKLSQGMEVEDGEALKFDSQKYFKNEEELVKQLNALGSHAKMMKKRENDKQQNKEIKSKKTLGAVRDEL